MSMEQAPREYDGDDHSETGHETYLTRESAWPVLYALLSSKNVRGMFVLTGVLATLLPWFISGPFSSDNRSLSLFSGLLAADNLGLEIGALLFCLGLLMIYFDGDEWSVAGGLVMIPSAIIFALSAQGLPGWGAGVFVGLLVTAYAFLPLLDLFLTLEESTLSSNDA
jgi:hypothetical protein